MSVSLSKMNTYEITWNDGVVRTVEAPPDATLADVFHVNAEAGNLRDGAWTVRVLDVTANFLMLDA